ncbi:DUF5804 family protein [Halorarum salinum]|uniref:Uncharacterized protein n=1 Tax=Halorarum salinum TaxID=2743089 RepID=A0A7D5LB79_9EURY|nr:DUF5804 family protein [Halobaculum salinum]QLG62410.1 hypothetical protein HUG12_11990 [Halobaculum salinum]
MPTVCLVGEPEVELRYELLSRETARDALSTYDLASPFENSIAVETVSLGAAVSLLNDLNWYLVRFVEEAFVKDPSVSGEEWLSRRLATDVRNDDVRPEETDRLLKVFGLEEGELVEPMFLARSDGAALPEYDLRDVEETVRVRVTEGEFEG